MSLLARLHLLKSLELQTTPLICETEPSEIYYPNGSDYAMIACYLELYEEGEVEHINGPTHPIPFHPVRF